MIPYDFFIFAGEPSGDLHGEALLKSLYALSPNLNILGVGGPRMRATGLTSLLPMEEFQVMGFTAVLCALPRILRHLFFLSKKIVEANPKVVVCIDYPGFCLRLERRLRKKGFTGKIVHYISPTVWAHGKNRAPFLEKYADLLLTIFPFEKAYFSPQFHVEYVGHPLIERIASYSYQPFSFAKEKRVIALFPGSRKKEIDLNFPLQVKTLKKILGEEKNLIGAISVSKQEFIPLLKATLKKEGVSLENIHFVPIEKTYELMAHSFLAIAKSGTVTLELALHKVPTIVLYKIAPIDLFIAKNILRIRLPFYCIVNIILQKEVFKELIGPFAKEESLLIEAKRLLKDTSYYNNKKELCKELISYMGTDKASDKAASLLLTSIKNNHSII